MKRILSYITILFLLSGIAWAGPQITHEDAYDPANVNIDGGTIDGTTIGGTTPAAGAFTTLKQTTGAAAGNMLVSDADGDLGYLSAGATTDVLVGGGAANPVWTAATGTDAPVRATSPTLVTPLLGTPTSGVMTNTTTATAADNTSSTALASTAYAKSQDAVLAREPNQGVALTAAASGSSGITVADNDNLDFGTGNFTLVWKGSLPDWTPSAQQVLIQTYQYYGGTDSRGLELSLQSAGTPRIIMYRSDGGLTVNATASVTNADGTAGDLVVVIVRETASVAGSVSFYNNGLLIGSAVAITAGTPGSISNEGIKYISGYNGVRTASTTHRALTFNRALSAAEVLDLYRNGVAEADKWGSQTELMPNQVDRDFSGASAWSNVSFGTYDETGDLSITASAAGQYISLPVASFPTTIGKRYRLSVDVANPVGRVTFRDFTHTESYAALVTLSAGRYSCEWTALTSGGMRIFAEDVNSSADFDNFSLTEIGATLALESSGIKTDKWYDSSSNALDGAYPTVGSSLTIPYQLGVESLLSVTNVSLAADADTTIYTVPTGRRLVLTKAILIVGADAGTTVISIGADGAETNWLPNNTLSALDAANDVGVLMPVPNATTVLGKSYAAGTVIQAKVSSQAGGATNSLRLFGYLY